MLHPLANSTKLRPLSSAWVPLAGRDLRLLVQNRRLAGLVECVETLGVWAEFVQAFLGVLVLRRVVGETATP